MRTWHRWVGGIFSIFLLSAGVTGAWLECQALFGEKSSGRKSAQANMPKIDTAQFELAQKIWLAQQAVAAQYADAKMRRIDIDYGKSPPNISVWLGGRNQRRVVVDSETFQIKDDQDVGSSLLLRVHTGAWMGDLGEYIGLLWGVALCGLVLSGMLLYGQMLRRRKKAGLSGIFWK